ncbi:MAG: DegT/DnrJ/EryC1/StrS family aminotransferase [Calditerrivibrio sp.]|nr:DegT/DnrJ/EryC1/StrS family aminotransferase [Calditerrivibrio sp.]
MVKFLDLKKQYFEIKEEIDRKIEEVLITSSFVGGKYVEKFEEEFAAYIGTKYCIGVGNGTDALEIVLESLDLYKGANAIVPANTFVATAESVVRVGYNPVFCDCDDYYLLSVEALKRISHDIDIVIPVHLYGQPCDMDDILDFSKKKGSIIIEDCAQAHGAAYKGRKVGSFGIAATFSFYPGKNLGAYGDAGAIVTNDEVIAKKGRLIANHGRVSKYEHIMIGRNSRIDGLQAAVLSVKLKYLDIWNNIRNQLGAYYTNLLSEVDYITPPLVKENIFHAYHLYVIKTDSRDKLQKYLKEKCVETGIHYPVSLPELEPFRRFPHENCYKAKANCRRILSLPIGEHMTERDVEYVVEMIKKFFEENLERDESTSLMISDKRLVL